MLGVACTTLLHFQSALIREVILSVRLLHLAGVLLEKMVNQRSGEEEKATSVGLRYMRTNM